MTIKNRTITVIIPLIMLSAMVSAQVKFLEVTNAEEMDHARKVAAEADMPLFVDVYATWCGPCKTMDREVYPDPAVYTYMNANFVSVRMDGELEYGRKFATDNELEGYPSMFIFSSSGESMSKIVGYTAAVELVQTLNSLVDNYTVVNRYKSRHQSGELRKDELAEYIKAMREMGRNEEAGQLAIDYIDKLQGNKLSDDEIATIAFYLTLDNIWWPLFSADTDRLLRVLGEDYMLAVENIFNRTLVKAIDNENLELISSISNEIPPLVEKGENKTTGLRTLPFLQYFYYTGKHDELISYVDDRYKVEKGGDHEWLFSTASQIIDMDQQYGTQVIIEKGVEWFKICIDLEEKYDYYFYHGMSLYLLKRPEPARESLLEAEKLAESDDQKAMIRQVLGFVDGQQ